MKAKTNINVEDAFAGVIFSDGKTLGRGTRVAKFNMPDRVCIGDSLTTTLFLN